MKPQLEKLIQDTIVYKYDLPNTGLSIEKTIFSTINDKCYSAEHQENLVSLIYNLIIDYAFNEFEIEEKDFSDLQSKAFEERIRFSESDSDAVQLKYGFFGEVVLFATLKIIFGADALISKGYFYSPIENSEAKGYDAYHVIENDSKIELWFGESKFHVSWTNAVNDVLGKIKKSLSDGYLKRNLLAIRKNKDHLNVSGSKIENILKAWDANPKVNIFDELKKYDIELVYPIIILFKETPDGYDESIKKIPEYIKKNYTLKSFDLSIPFTLYFVFIPIKDVMSVKKEVLSWIKSKKQPL